MQRQTNCCTRGLAPIMLSQCTAPMLLHACECHHVLVLTSSLSWVRNKGRRCSTVLAERKVKERNRRRRGRNYFGISDYTELFGSLEFKGSSTSSALCVSVCVCVCVCVCLFVCVCVSHFSLPRIGDTPMMTDARALFTCGLGSETRACDSKTRWPKSNQHSS